MNKIFLVIIFCLVSTVTSSVVDASNKTTLKSLNSKYPMNKGFIGHLFDDDKGKLYLRIDNIDNEFIYQTSLPQGLGSNDIGLDRGQLGDTRLVEFNRVGNKVLLVQKNTRYRAVSDNKNEAESVKQAFASSILWSFPVIDAKEQWVLVDASDFILQDSHGVARKLAARKQGSFKLDKSRSAIFLPRTKSFPDNTELEASITFTSDKPGQFVQQAAANPNVVSLRMHHSFVRLPKAGYKPRKFHPKSGYWSFEYQDYAQPINKPITQRFIGRHRLEKIKPNAPISEAVEPIIYYLDPGAPEPVKTALLTGASWWNDAFEAIGYKNAFQVKILPDGADPMDVRYNVIQWVHRATRGWSYGYGVIDPRNGEIIKGHVTLGSLRVRQDYLIAQGMMSLFDKGEADQALMDMALSRIRQLSAHEIGHTIGIAHNFAASSYNRASVMDYPHPLFEINEENGKKSIHAENAYAEGIGIWDKAVIEYGYQEFPDGNEEQQLAKILENNRKAGYLYISDPDARRISDAHPKASLWDNGENSVDELERVLNLRRVALDNFGLASLHSGRPYSDLQEILIPVYYFHRYQATAAAKWIGGVDYDYSVKHSSKTAKTNIADSEEQKRALAVLLRTLTPEFLSIDSNLADLLLPKAMGYRKDRESLIGKTGTTFDQRALARASAQHTLSLILNSTRLARIEQQNRVDSEQLSISGITRKLHKAIVDKEYRGIDGLMHQATVELLYSNYINLVQSANTDTSVKLRIFNELRIQKKYLAKKLKRVKENSDYYSFYHFQLERISKITPSNLDANKLIQLPSMPPGSPI